MATTAAVAAGGIAYASIPDSSGRIHACYNSSATQLIDPATTNACPSGFNYVYWNQIGRTGPTGPVGPKGDTGPQGPQGLPGRNDQHWVVTKPDNSYGWVLSSDSDVYVFYGGPGRNWVWFPRRDTTTCSINVTANNSESQPIMTGYRKLYGYIYAFANKLVVSNGQAVAVPVATEMSITASC